MGADLSELVVLVLGFANLVADGLSIGASNFLSRRSYADEAERADPHAAASHGAATIVGFVTAGTVPLLAQLVPLSGSGRFPAAIVLTLATLFAVGASRTFGRRRGRVRRVPDNAGACSAG